MAEAINRNRAAGRRIVNGVFVVACGIATLIALGALVLIFWSLVSQGLGGLDTAVFTMTQPAPGSPGGLANAIIGSLMMCAVAMAIAVVIGVLAGTYLAEYGGNTAYGHVVRFLNDVLLSAPSILVGLFVYEMLVSHTFHHFTGWAGAVALAFLAAPIVTRTTEDILRLQSDTLREAGMALGATRSFVIRKIIWRAAGAGMLTGGLLGFARISGETAPLLFTALGNQFISTNMAQPMASLPTTIFQFALSAYDDWRRLAWVGALLIAVTVLFINIVGRLPREKGAPPMNATTAVPVNDATPEQAMTRPSGDLILEARGLNFFYGKNQSLYGVDLPIERNRITALIGPSGCGKSTLLRALNRIYDLYPGQRAEGEIALDGEDVLANRDLASLRARVGMVFQKPTPFPMSIYDNVAFGVKLYHRKSRAEMDALVETSLRRAALWDEVKDKLNTSGLGLSGGQQQRLCVARGIAVNPRVLLLDEPASALDPISTAKLEATLLELKRDVTIVIVTHNLQQAARVSDHTGFMYLGRMIEFGPTPDMFSNPRLPRTRDYITGPLRLTRFRPRGVMRRLENAIAPEQSAA